MLIVLYRKWFLQLPLFTPFSFSAPQTFFSIIIPARNEEGPIVACLQSILQQPYPTNLYEVIVINDHSTDETEARVNEFQLQYPQISLIHLKDYLDGKLLNAYKKKAIELAIKKSKGNWIVTTDADCMVPANWLLNLDAYIQKNNPVFVAAPVMFTHHHGFLSIFQLIDFISLQGITAASVSAGHYAMCNGANIAYRKDVFFEVGQFTGIDQKASGDDMLLMHKMKQAYPNKIGYLFSPASIVLTTPMESWKKFIHQRIRWASKADSYRDKNIFFTLLLVYLVNLGLLVLLLSSFFVSGGLIIWLLLMVAKTGIELTFMLPVAAFYKQSKTLIWFPFLQPFHIVYTVVAGWLGKFGTYQWKGRTVT